jgi:tetratricopeptide (TPR) repeat protein
MMRVLSIAIAVLWLGQASALAQPSSQAVDTAQDLFTKATTAYNLGRFEEAVTLFSKAYEAWPQPEFLYNIAQSHRLAKNCAQALHFYKRFLSTKDQDTAPLSPKKREEIDNFISELEACVAKLDSSASKQPDTLVKPEAAPAAVASSAGGAAAEVSTASRAEAPGVAVVSVAGGVALLGAGDLGIPMQPVVRLVAGYPIHIDPVTIALGGALSYTPLPYAVMDEQRRGAMLGIRAAAIASYPVTPKLSLHGELGLGIVSLSGLGAGNPISADRSAGTFTLPSVALGLGLDYELARGITATVSPLSVVLSRGADGMYANSMREVDIVVGLGYRP